jgi:hypothetical protein
MPIYLLGFDGSLSEFHVLFLAACCFSGGWGFFQTAFAERKASIEEAAVIILIDIAWVI